MRVERFEIAPQVFVQLGYVDGATNTGMLIDNKRPEWYGTVCQMQPRCDAGKEESMVQKSMDWHRSMYMRVACDKKRVSR
jgi:hypothetical protein